MRTEGVNSINIYFMKFYVMLYFLWACVNQINTAKKNQHTTDFLQDNRSFGFFIPVHIPLNNFRDTPEPKGGVRGVIPKRMVY